MKYLMFVFTALMLCLSGCTRIDTGNIGVERTVGKISPEELPPGMYVTVFKTVGEFSTKEVLLPLYNMSPKSRDNLTMQDLDIDIYFKVNPAKVADLVIKYQGDVTPAAVDKEGRPTTSELLAGWSRVQREAREAVYTAVAAMDATTMHTQRQELSASVHKLLQTALNTSDPEAFAITSINVRSLTTDKGLEASILARAATDQAIAKKDKDIELARKEAERLEVVALGTARYNEIISASLTDRLIRLKEIESQTAFAKEGTHTVLLQGDAKPLVGVGK